MCVHTRHCCKVHGCKYGENDHCPVWLGYEDQSTPCDLCDSFPLQITSVDKLPEISEEELSNRRKLSNSTY